MRVIRLILPVLLGLTGCGQKDGHGLWSLRVGGDAKLASPDGSDLVVETLGTASRVKGKRPQRKAAAPPTEHISLPSGTRVRVLAIDGDDARIEVKEGPRAGSALWIECSRLEPTAD